MSWSKDERGRVLEALARLWPGELSQPEAAAFEGALRRFEARAVLAALTRAKQEQTTNRRPLIADLVKALNEAGAQPEGESAKLDGMLANYGRSGRMIVRRHPIHGLRAFRLFEHGVEIAGDTLVVEKGELRSDPSRSGEPVSHFVPWRTLEVAQKERLLTWCREAGSLSHAEIEEIPFAEFLRRAEAGEVQVEGERALSLVGDLLASRRARGGGWRTIDDSVREPGEEG